MQNKSMFDRYLEAMQKTGDIMLQWYFQKQMIKDEMLSEREIDRIAEKVLSRISIRLEAEAISQLRNMLNDLGKKGGV